MSGKQERIGLGWRRRGRDLWMGLGVGGLILAGILLGGADVRAQAPPNPLQANAVWVMSLDVSLSTDVVTTVGVLVDGVDVVLPVDGTTVARAGDTITITDRPGLAVGSHQAGVRFCNVAGCSAPFQFTITAMTTPGTPTNLRLSLKQLADAIRAVGSAVDDVAASLGQ